MTLEERVNFYIEFAKSLAVHRGAERAMDLGTGLYLRPASDEAQEAMRAQAAEAAAKVEEDDEFPHHTLGHAAADAPWSEWWTALPVNEPPRIRVAGDEFRTFESIAEDFSDPEDFIPADMIHWNDPSQAKLPVAN
jgi:hypothetical protein